MTSIQNVKKLQDKRNHNSQRNLTISSLSKDATKVAMSIRTGARPKEKFVQEARPLNTYDWNHYSDMPYGFPQPRHITPVTPPLSQSNQDHGNLLTIMQRQNDITALLMQQHSSLSLPPKEYSYL